MKAARTGRQTSQETAKRRTGMDKTSDQHSQNKLSSRQDILTQSDFYDNADLQVIYQGPTEEHMHHQSNAFDKEKSSHVTTDGNS